MSNKYYSNGKLLLTGEYLVLDGAKALAVPTKYGQDLAVSELEESVLIWESYDNQQNCWFMTEFRLSDLRIVSETFDTDNDDSKESIALTLQKILLQAQEMNSEFLKSEKGFLVKTNLTFPRDWGLGTSSTLINNIASWAQVDAFELLNKSFGGSGYDIACAQNDTPITYQIANSKPIIEPVVFDPEFKDQLFFVYLNVKQNSRTGIKRYKDRKQDLSQVTQEINEITRQFQIAKTIKELEVLIDRHEQIIAEVIGSKTVKELVFPDYFGTVKSLGAWGGDFVLVTGNETTPTYFKAKGFDVVIPYGEMVIGVQSTK